jgi:hypothetical protein
MSSDWFLKLLNAEKSKPLSLFAHEYNNYKISVD